MEAGGIVFKCKNLSVHLQQLRADQHSNYTFFLPIHTLSFAFVKVEGLFISSSDLALL